MQINQFAPFARGDGQPISEQDAVGGDRSNFFSWREDAGQIQRVCRGESCQATGSRLAPDGSQLLDGFGQATRRR